MELENITLEKKGHVAVITINHPPANAWNLATMLDFEKVVDRILQFLICFYNFLVRLG